MPDQLRSMEVFARVVSAGSFSAAGRALDMSQTMVTKHVAALERRLGVQLLRRTTQRVTPTEAGQRFAQSAERILEEIREAEALAAAETVEPQGTLRISAPLSFGLREFSRVVPAYLARHDKVRLDVDFNDRLVDILSEGFDMAIRIGPAEGFQPDGAAPGPLQHPRLRCAFLYRAARGAPVRCTISEPQLPGLHALHRYPRRTLDLR